MVKANKKQKHAEKACLAREEQKAAQRSEGKRQNEGVAPGAETGEHAPKVVAVEKEAPQAQPQPQPEPMDVDKENVPPQNHRDDAASHQASRGQQREEEARRLPARTAEELRGQGPVVQVLLPQGLSQEMALPAPQGEAQPVPMDVDAVVNQPPLDDVPPTVNAAQPGAARGSTSTGTG